MADFSFLSDSDDDKAVEELISQAVDHSVLKQVAAINCSGFDPDSVLPTHLETRFSKLKSFPATKPKSKNFSTSKSSASSSSFNPQLLPNKPLKPQLDSDFDNPVGEKSDSELNHDNEKVFVSPTKEDPIGKKGLTSKLKSGFSVSPSTWSDSSTEIGIFSPSKQKSYGKSGPKSKTLAGSSRSHSNSWSSSMESRSPPHTVGCFWCSPKKEKKKEYRVDGIIDLDWGKDEEFLSDLNSFSTKAQQKLLKKAMMEEEKINREAEKIVKLAKQASARMEVSGFDDELSDIENTK